MNKRRLYAVAAGLGVTASVALALLFGIFQPGPGAVRDVDPGASSSSVDAEAANEVASALGGEYGEAIKVHGHWTIEVRDPDGGLVERREFDNALGPNADIVLARIIGGVKTVGLWSIEIDDDQGIDRPCGGQPCRILESGTLTVSAPLTGSDIGKLVLSGSVTATNNGIIGLVNTFNELCAPTAAPSANCVGAPDFEFNNLITFAFIIPRVSVSAGQQILVTVVIGFS